MKTIFIILALICASFATNSTTNLTNATINIGYGDCVNVTNDGFNWTVICAPDIQTINLIQTLNYSQNYTNNTLNLTIIAPSLPPNITCPPQQLWNISTTLNPGQSITNPTLNATINCSYPNLFVNLTSGQNYNNNTISFVCSYSKLNINQTLLFDTNYTNTDVNITIFSPKFPALGVRKNLTIGQQFSSLDSYDIRYNFSVNCIASTSDCASLQTAINLLNTSLEQNISNLNECKTQVANLTNKTCAINETMGNLNVTTLTNQILLCNSTAIVMCSSELNELQCSDEEKLKGQYIPCLSRIINDSQVNYQQCLNEKAKTTEDYTRCNTAQTANIQTTDNIINLVLVFIGLGCSIFVAAYLIYRQRKKEVG